MCHIALTFSEKIYPLMQHIQHIYWWDVKESMILFSKTKTYFLIRLYTYVYNEITYSPLIIFISPDRCQKFNRCQPEYIGRRSATETFTPNGFSVYSVLGRPLDGNLLTAKKNRISSDFSNKNYQFWTEYSLNIFFWIEEAGIVKFIFRFHLRDRSIQFECPKPDRDRPE